MQKCTRVCELFLIICITFIGGPSPDVLQDVMVPLISNEKCNQGYGGSITHDMICAGFDDGGYDACQVLCFF